MVGREIFAARNTRKKEDAATHGLGREQVTMKLEMMEAGGKWRKREKSDFCKHVYQPLSSHQRLEQSLVLRIFFAYT